MSLGLQRNTIKLVDHDAVWKEIAFQTTQELWKIFGPVAKDIQHIGSTSIESIKAKPIIDLAVAVDDFSMFQPLIPKLEREGYTYCCKGL